MFSPTTSQNDSKIVAEGELLDISYTCSFYDVAKAISHGIKLVSVSNFSKTRNNKEQKYKLFLTMMATVFEIQKLIGQNKFGHYQIFCHFPKFKVS